MARPIKLTPEVHKQIVKYCRLGNFRETAASAAGIDCRTLRNWLKRAAEGEEPFAELAKDLDAAEANAEARDVAIISKAGRGAPEKKDKAGNIIHAERGPDWKALAWRLERKAPSRWAFRVKVEVNAELDAFLDKLEQNLDPETFERVLLAAFGSAGDGASRAPDGDATPILGVSTGMGADSEAG